MDERNFVILHFQKLRRVRNFNRDKMYAIVEIAGQQIKVETKREYYVNRLQGDEATQVIFENILLIDDDSTIRVGRPRVEGARVKATISEHIKSDKVLIFKKKRRKGYQKLNGHRQPLSKIIIEEISVA
jgi:large subunit ribosomal protein L21